MLVSIYDCRDSFVEEYQRLLANNLISNGWGKPMDAEEKYLKHMKKRFTDGELDQCEVMLKDIRDSMNLYNIAVSDGMASLFNAHQIYFFSICRFSLESCRMFTGRNVKRI
jgi:hypothetical protein